MPLHMFTSCDYMLSPIDFFVAYRAQNSSFPTSLSTSVTSENGAANRMYHLCGDGRYWRSWCRGIRQSPCFINSHVEVNDLQAKKTSQTRLLSLRSRCITLCLRKQANCLMRPQSCWTRSQTQPPFTSRWSQIEYSFDRMSHSPVIEGRVSIETTCRDRGRIIRIR